MNLYIEVFEQLTVEFGFTTRFFTSGQLLITDLCDTSVGSLMWRLNSCDDYILWITHASSNDQKVSVGDLFKGAVVMLQILYVWLWIGYLQWTFRLVATGLWSIRFLYMGLFFLPSYLHDAALSPIYANRLPQLLKIDSSAAKFVGIPDYNFLLMLTLIKQVLVAACLFFLLKLVRWIYDRGKMFTNHGYFSDAVTYECCVVTWATVLTDDSLDLAHLLHTVTLSKLFACASIAQGLTMNCTATMLDSFTFQILEQLVDHREMATTSSSNLHQLLMVSSRGYLCAFTVRLGLFVCRLQDQFTLQLLQPLSSYAHYRLCETALRWSESFISLVHTYKPGS